MNTPRRFRLAALVRRSLRQRAIRVSLFVGAVALVAGSVAGFATYSHFAPTLPEFRSLDDFQPKVGTRIYSADHQLIGEFAEERRVLVPFERIPPRMFSAFIAAEDKRFYSHWGVDFLGVGQAVADKILHPSAKLRGASTITQQVAKSLLATHESYAAATERSLTRKLREAILAWRLENTLSKNDILYIYATQIFLGHKAYGVQAAAEHYFRKNVWELSLAEMATLAGLPQRPSDYSPYSRPEAAMSRRTYVLRRMLIDGYISQAEHDEAVAEQIAVYPRRELYLQVAPYFTEEVRRELVDRYGERSIIEDGLKVYTTLDLSYQKYAQDALIRGLRSLDRRQGFRGPMAHLEADKRAVFKELYRKHLGLGPDQDLIFEKGTYYLGVVTGFESGGKAVHLDIAGKAGLLPVGAMRWARKPNPVESYEFHSVADAREALRKGDVVAVRRTTRKQLAQDIFASAAMSTVPEGKDDMLFRLEQEPIAQSAVMSVDTRTGYVLAQVGGYNFEESSFNRATQACREPGSAFKPIVYSAAIDKLDFTASTLIDDKPLVFDDADNEVRWKPANSGLEFRGSIPMRTCLMESINIPAIRIAEAVGIEDLIKNARNLGMRSPIKRELGTALGSSCTTLLDLARVYTTFARYGEQPPVKFITRVVDRYGNVLEDHSDPADPLTDLSSRLDRAYEKMATPLPRALDPQSSFLTVSLMRNVVRAGTATRAAKLGIPVAGKTGTTDDSFDTWFMGFTPNIVTGVWVGHDKKERPLGINEQGGRTAAPIWVDYMGRALMDYTVDPPRRISHGEFVPPPGIVRAAIDPDTGLLARPEGRSVTEYYRQGSQPTEYSPDKAVLDPDHWNAYDVDPG